MKLKTRQSRIGLRLETVQKNQQGQKKFLIKDKRGFNSVAEEIKTIQGFNELGLLT